MRKFLVVALTLWVGLELPLEAAELFSDGGVIETIGHGEVNWTTHVIRARGSGAPNLDSPNIAVVRLGAERAAKMDAMRNVLETVKGIRISSQTSFGDQMLKSDIIQAKVEGLVKGAKVVDTKYFSDGGVDIIIELPLLGQLANLVIPPSQEITLGSGTKKIASSLVIDARGIKFFPALAPSVFDESGREVYCPAKVDSQVIVRYGMISYHRNLEEARKTGRVGDNPLVIRALRANPPGFSDLVISNSEAEKLRDPGVDLSFLREGKVFVLAD